MNCNHRLNWGNLGKKREHMRKGRGRGKEKSVCLLGHDGNYDLNSTQHTIEHFSI